MKESAPLASSAVSAHPYTRRQTPTPGRHPSMLARSTCRGRASRACLLAAISRGREASVSCGGARRSRGYGRPWSRGVSVHARMRVCIWRARTDREAATDLTAWRRQTNIAGAVHSNVSRPKLPKRCVGSFQSFQTRPSADYRRGLCTVQGRLAFVAMSPELAAASTESPACANPFHWSSLTEASCHASC